MPITIPSPVEQDPNRVFRLAPEYRRCGVYLVLGWLLVGGLMLGLHFSEDPIRSWSDLCTVLTVLSALFLGSAVTLLRYGLRVDERGIWRRHLFRWDLWPWEAFTTGAVRTGRGPDTWVYPDKPWYSRHLHLGSLAKADCNTLMEQIRQVWKPTEVVLPDEMKIRYGLGKHLELSPRGILIAEVKGDRPRSYTWSDVVQLRVTRFDHWRRDFWKLDLELPTGEEVLRLRRRSDAEGRYWTGPDAEVVLAYLLQYIGSDRIQVTALRGAPRNRDEAERRLRDLDRSYRDAQRGSRISYASLLILYLLVLFKGQGAFAWNRFQWFAAGGLFLVLGLLGVSIWMGLAQARRRGQIQRAELTNWIARNQEQVRDRLRS
jgi:hypothetical protein